MSLKNAVAKTFFDFAYAIAYRPVTESGTSFPKGGTAPFRLLKPTLRQWYADPLLATVNGKEYLFMEVFDRKKKKGMIGVSKITDHQEILKPRIILEEDFHLSFPLVFSYEDRYILMPECSESKTLRLYALDPSTLNPSLIRAIPVKERLVDTVVLKTGDHRLTLLACKEDSENPKKTSLVCFSLDSPEDGEPVEIPLPSGYTSPSYLLRNGGPVIFDDNNQKIRILQESTETEYGHNIILCKIESEGRDYRETEISRIYLEDLPVRLPLTYRKQGTHTYCPGGMMEVFDISFNRFHPGNIFYRKLH